MKQYKTHENQSWFDISIALYGAIDYALDLATLNNSSITEDLIAGSIISYPTRQAISYYTLEILKQNNSIPATAMSLISDLELEKEGIGYWVIESNFKVI